MATFAKILGMLCLAAAGLNILVGVFVFSSAGSQDDTTGLAATLGVLYLLLAFGGSVLLATFGAMAWLVSDIWEQGESMRVRAWGTERAYGASSRT